MSTQAQNGQTRANGNGQAIVPNQQIATIEGLLNDPARKAKMAAVLPKHLTADRMIKVALNSIAKVPDLQKCTAASLMQCIITCAELGLEPGGALGHAYLVPFAGTCTLIIGYRGFIELARRSGQLAQIEARVVYENDDFEMEFGLNMKLRHVPIMDGEPGAARFVYCIARLKDGSTHVEVMTRKEVEAIRNRSRSGSKGPWVSDWGEMAKKTAVRRAAKYLPLSAELARAVEHDDGDYIDGEVVPVAQHALPADTVLTNEITGAATKKAKEALKAKRVQMVDVAEGETVDDAFSKLEPASEPAEAQAEPGAAG